MRALVLSALLLISSISWAEESCLDANFTPIVKASVESGKLLRVYLQVKDTMLVRPLHLKKGVLLEGAYLKGRTRWGLGSGVVLKDKMGAVMLSFPSPLQSSRVKVLDSTRLLIEVSL